MSNDGPEQRQSKRYKVFEFAAIHSDNGSAAGVIDDISAEGVLVTCELELTIGQEVVFELEDFGVIPAIVRHVRGSLAGMSLILEGEKLDEFVVWLENTEKEN
jgi:PilZ domain